MLGGRRLEERLTRLRSTAALPFRCAPRQLGRGRPELAPGSHRLELPSLDTAADPQADYLYFAAVVSRESASEYLSLGGVVGQRPEIGARIRSLFAGAWDPSSSRATRLSSSRRTGPDLVAQPSAARRQPRQRQQWKMLELSIC